MLSVARDFEIRHRSIPEGRRRHLLLIGHNLTIPCHIAIGYGVSISILRRQRSDTILPCRRRGQPNFQPSQRGPSICG